MALISEIFLALFVIVILILWLRLTSKNKEFYKTIPGPPPLPIFGNVLDIKSTEVVLDVLMRYSKEYGGVLKVHSGPIHKNIFISDYKWLECILSATRLLNKSDDYNFLMAWLGTGLLTSKGPKWRKHRRIITPAFHFQILEQFIEVFESGGDKLVEKLEKEVNKNSVDVYPLVTLCTLDIICETAMGTKINAQDNGESEYVRSVKAMCKIIIERSFSVIQMFDLTYPLTKNYYTEKNALKILHGQTNNVIARRRKEVLENKNKSKKDQDATGAKKKKAFLDLLLETEVDGRPLTLEEIREEVDTFMFEGHDTTASAISFALFCLANHPEVQAKALEEQKALFGDTNNPNPTYSDLQSMRYLEQVIKETLRLYPSVPFYSRKTNEPIEFNGTVIPEDVTLTIFTYAIHRDPTYFQDPEKFNPSRFDDFDGTKPYSFIPFSAGPRNCIGQKFAMLEMKSTISKVIRKFELSPATPRHELRLTAETVLKSANGIKISLKTRN